MLREFLVQQAREDVTFEQACQAMQALAAKA
jgi:hypothetical protein